jgi:hypothetical protein
MNIIGTIDIREFYKSFYFKDTPAKILFAPDKVVTRRHTLADKRRYILSFEGRVYLKLFENAGNYAEGIYELCQGYLHLCDDPSEYLFDDEQETDSLEQRELIKANGGCAILDSSFEAHKNLHIFARINEMSFYALSSDCKNLDNLEFIAGIYWEGSKSLGAYFMIDELTASYEGNASDYYFDSGLNLGFLGQEIPPEIGT